MFWRFGGYASISSIDTLLEKPDVTLEEVLDESELMQELKQHNTKLIEYLREDNVMKRLLDYVISPSLIEANNGYDDDNDETDEKGGRAAADEKETTIKEHSIIPAETEDGRGKKGAQFVTLSPDLDSEELETAEKNRLNYAYIASEILASSSWSITESMMLNEAYLREFWGFIYRKAPLDALQSGYFTKVNEVLLDKKTEEMLNFFKSLNGVIPAMLQHVDNPMIMDLLLKIMSLERAEGGQGIVEWLQTQKLIPMLLSHLSTEHSASTQTSAGDFLKAVITISANAAQNDPSCIGPNSLTRELVSESCVNQLISAMLKGGNPLTVGVGIVIEVIRKNNSDYDPESPGGLSLPPTVHDPIYLGTLLRGFAKHVPNFMESILSSKHVVNDGGVYKVTDRGQLKSTWGTGVEPLGFDRFKTCELMAELLHCSNIGLLNEIGSDDYIRNRDAEREQIRKQEETAHHEDESGFEYADTSKDHENGDTPSVLGSSAPEVIKKSDIPHSSEEDGFEEVSHSGIPVDGAKNDAHATSHPDPESKQLSEQPTSGPPYAPKLGVSDDFVDEPLTPPQTEQSLIPDDASPQPPSQAKAYDPISPTTSGLTEKVETFSIDNVNKPLTESSESIKTDDVLADISRVQDSMRQSNEELPQDPLLSPRLSDTPAPLFSSSPARHEAAASEVAQDSQHSGTSEDNTATPSISPSVTMGDIDTQLAQQIQIDSNGRPVVGDYLKIMFVEHKVVPTILSFFFRFPWNNFLHNVVYDVVQQVFNGSMDRGFNRALAIDVFEAGHITEQIVEGQRRSDETQKTKNMRMGYMGHLTLIAEEVVRFSERHPPELLSASVMEKVLHADWIDYVERTLSETRERDNAILGGVRPDMSMGSRAGGLNATQGLTGSSALANAGLNGGMSGSGLDSFDLVNQGSASGGVFGYPTGGPSLLSGFGSSSDDEDEEMEDPEDEELRKAAAAASGADNDNDNENPSSNSTSQSIPILPPPAPLNTPPSRARRQLAARLALQKQNAEAAEANSSAQASNEVDSHSGNIRIGLDKNRFAMPSAETEGGAFLPGTVTGAGSSTLPFPSNQGIYSSPQPLFSQPNSGSRAPFSPDSSDDEEEEEQLNYTEAVQRKVRLPLEVDDDPDDMGEMVGSSSLLASASPDDDDDDAAMFGESLGYSSYFARYAGGPPAHQPEDREGSSDGEDDEGLVEISMPGRRSSS